MKPVFENPQEWLTENEYASWLFKYVRFADGTVLFCDACTNVVSHKTIVDAKPDVPAVSAGKIQVRHGKWCITEGGSSTAKLTSLPSDEKYIDRAISPHGFVYDSEMCYSL